VEAGDHDGRYAQPDQRRVLATLFDAGNLYLGTITGEFIGELCLSLWFVPLGLALVTPRLDHLHLGTRAWRWVGGLGLFTGISMSIGAFRNVVGAVGPIAALNNNLLPLWLIALGAMLLGTCRTPSSDEPAHRTSA